MAEQIHQGRVLSVRSSVVDIWFPVAPPIRNVLVAGEKGEYIIEVFTQLDNNTVRGVALTPTQGLSRGAVVTDTGKPFEVPVGQALMGRVFNVFGSTIDKKGAVDGCELRSIHHEPIPLRDQSTVSEIFETGIKAIDVLAPLELYSMLSPMERLARSRMPAVRAAVAKALGRFLYKRTFLSLRALIADPEPQVRLEACRAVEQLRFPHAFDPLARIFRESADNDARMAALRALAHVDTDEAAEMVVGLLLHAGPGERDALMAAVSGARNERLLRAANDALPTAGEAGNVLRTLLRSRGVGG